jgi:hypothetical protein
LIFLAFIVPLAVYCLVLSFINGKRQPVVVSGPWDFAGVLFAVSGILLVGGPAILTGFYEHWRLFWLLGETPYLHEIGKSWSFWSSVWLVYFAMVAGGSTWMLWRRRSLTSIYNVEPAVFVDVLTQLLDRLGMEWRRHGPNRLLVRCREPALPAGNTVPNPVLPSYALPTAAHPAQTEDGAAYLQPSPITAEPVSRPLYAWAEVVLEPFPVLRHMTLRWSGPHGAVRPEIEAELVQALAQIRTHKNAISAWFLSLALGLFFSAFMVLVALVALEILRLRR